MRLNPITRYQIMLAVVLAAAAAAAAWPANAEPEADPPAFAEGTPPTGSEFAAGESGPPSGAISRAEAARMLTLGLGLPLGGQVALPDLAGHWSAPYAAALLRSEIIDLYPDGTFRPDAPVSRAEMANLMIGSMGLADLLAFVEPQTPPFPDVPASHPHARAISLAKQLRLIPLAGERFHPSRAVSRQEASAMMDAARHRYRVIGEVTAVDGPGSSLLLQIDQDGGEWAFRLSDSTLIVADDGAEEPRTHLAVGERVHLITDPEGLAHLIFVQVEPPAAGLLPTEVAVRAGELIRGLLTPSDVRAIARGDWDALAQSASQKLYDRLIEQGAYPHEADAILRRDWRALGEAGRSRLAELVSTQLHISRELTEALLHGDWEQARTLAQAEAVEYLLNELLLERA